LRDAALSLTTRRRASMNAPECFKCHVIGTALIMTVLSGCGSKPLPTGTTVGGGGATTTTTVNLNDLTLASGTVIGGNPVQGTVTLSSAPTSAATVALSSNNGAATVPSAGNVTVNAGSTTGTFTINTTTVTSSTATTISATLSGTTKTANLTVNPRPLAASFVVTALSGARRKTANDPAGGVEIFPAGTQDVCPLIVLANGNQTLDCRFDGTASTSPTSIQTYLWTYLFAQFRRDETSTTPQYKPAESGCNFFGNKSSTSSGGVTFLQLVVQLQVKDPAGNLSPVVSNQNVRIFPNGQCGYGF
jgi:hypothetical protein